MRGGGPNTAILLIDNDIIEGCRKPDQGTWERATVGNSFLDQVAVLCGILLAWEKHQGWWQMKS